MAKAVVRLMAIGVCVGLSPLAVLRTNLPQLFYIFTTTFTVTKCTTCPAYSKYTKLTSKTLLRKSTVKVSKSTIIAQYNTTTVSINGVNTTINSGDIVKNLRKINIMKRYFVISVNGYVDGIITISGDNWFSIKNKIEPLVKRYIDINYSVDINTFVEVYNDNFVVNDKRNKNPIIVDIKKVNLWTEENIINY